MAIEWTQVDSIISKYGPGRGALIAMLLDIQGAFSYLPPQSLERVAEKMGLPTMHVYQVARFYKAFSLKPRGKHVISVCAGTACYTREGASLLGEIGRLLHITPGEATEDGQFTLETVNCPGSCPAGPMMMVDGSCHGRVAPSEVESLLKPYATAKEAVARD